MDRQPHVTVLYDVEDWSFHNIANNVSTVVSHYDFSLYGKADWFKKPKASEIVQKSDVIVFLWRYDVLMFLESLDDAAWERMLGPDRPAIVAMVYDHLYIDADGPKAPSNPYPVCDLVCASSKKLQNIYNASPQLPDVFESLADGVNLERFHSPEGGRSSDAPLSIGWVGNSGWGEKFGHDIKGRRTVFDVALQILEERGLPFERRIADRMEVRVPFDEMPAFYRNLDVLVCTSAIEGTPNPVLEAMASGAAVVTTDVGIVTESFGEKQSGFIIERAAEPFADALAKLIENRDLHLGLCAENVSRRDTLSWLSRAHLWKGVFEKAIAEARAPDNPRREILAEYRVVPPKIGVDLND
jgi:glycosyltransferase involved in cell wall biosynthesis